MKKRIILLLLALWLPACDKVPLQAQENVRLRWPTYTIVHLEHLDSFGTSHWLAVPPDSKRSVLMIHVNDNGYIIREVATGLYVESAKYVQPDRGRDPETYPLSNGGLFGGAIIVDDREERLK